MRRTMVGMLATAMVLGGLAATTAAAGPAGAAVVAPPGLVPVTPTRLFDTRSETLGRVPPNGIYVLDLSAQAPPDATAVAMNVTVTEAVRDGYVTVHACDGPQPATSNLNVEAGGTVPNLVTIGLGASREVCFVAHSGGHLLADLAGWYVLGDGLGFQAITPQRLVDTRDRPAPIPAGQTLVVDLSDDVAPDTGAVALNVTATDPAASGYLTVWPCDADRPEASNVNYERGQTVPNAAVVRLGADRLLCVFTWATADVIVDLNGLFRASQPDGLYDTPPLRVLDTRVSRPAPVPSGQVVVVTTPGGTGTALLLNLTVTDPTGPGYLTAFPCGDSPPTASNVNFEAGQTVANFVAVGVGASDAVCILVFANGGAADLIVDVFGTFSPAPVTL
jgi:hypothetical protein